MAEPPLARDSNAPTNTKLPMVRYVICRPDVNADKTPVSAESDTAASVGRWPIEAITAVMMAVDTAMPVTLAEFRTRLRKPEITPYLLCSTVLKIELLLGALKAPLPKLWITMAPITSPRGEFTDSVARMKSPVADMVRPPTLNMVHP